MSAAAVLLEGRRMWPLRCFLIFSIVLLPGGPYATTFPVTKTADTDDGVCDADCSLREAIDAANTNAGADDVPVPAGFYLLTLGQLVVSDDVDIAGAGQTNTIIDGNASDRVFAFYFSGVTEIAGVTIQNGDTSISGGGIRNDFNVALSLTESTVSGNTAYLSGGGIFNQGDLTLTNSTVSGNTAYRSGGGLYSSNAHGGLVTSTLINSTVTGNTAYSSGGGIVSFGDLTLTNSTVSGNHAGSSGGGIDNRNYLTLTNSTVSGNTADRYGAGIHNFFASATLTNSTVSGNGGNFGNSGIEMRVSFVDVINTIVADNLPYNCNGDEVDSLGYNLTDDTTCGITEPSDLVVADALLYPLGDFGGPTETHHPMSSSPAIDAADDASCPATDQRGEARPFDGDGDGFADCDIGAVEFVPEPGGWLLLAAGAGLLGALYRRRMR